MRFKNKSVYFLLLAIIIPSAILAFFSLSTLKSQKSLMDKELSSRSYAISTGISEQVEKVFKETESTALSSIKSKSTYDEITKKSKRLPVRQILLIGRDYSLKYPDIPWINESETPKIKLSTEFTSKFTGVEKKEISGKFEEAISGYKKLKRNTSDAREKAIVLNAIARSCGRVGKQDEALAIYEQIYKNFAQEKSVSNTSLRAVAYLQSAGIYLAKGEIRKTAEFYAFLLSGIMNKRLKCTKDEGLFYKEIIENAVDNLIKRKSVKDDDLTLCNNLIRQFDNIVLSEKLAGIVRKQNLLKDAGSKRYSYFGLDDESLLGYKAISDEDVLLFCLNTNHLRERIVGSIKQALRYTEEFDYEIADSNNQIFLSSLKTRLLNPITREFLTSRLPGWRIRVRVKESEALRRNAHTRMYINTGIIIVLILVIGISIYFMFRMMYRERELSSMKTDFVSSVSHEMRTPLTTIRMIGEMFRIGSVKDETLAKEYYDTLSGETERLTRLINKVLDFSRIDSGRNRYNFAMEDTGSVAASTVKAFEKYAEGNGYKIELNIQQNLPKIKVDADAISQVILNLLDNAMKYSPVNKNISVNVYKKEGNVVVEVIDKGIGIEAGKIDRIFERFYRGEDELTRETKGTGVGLSIVKHIIDAHEGKIEVKSKKGKGSTFTVILPIT